MLGPPRPLQKGGLERSVIRRWSDGGATASPPTPPYRHYAHAISGCETRERGRIEDKPFAARRVREPMDSKRATGIRFGQHAGLKADIAAFPKGADKRFLEPIKGDPAKMENMKVGHEVEVERDDSI